MTNRKTSDTVLQSICWIDRPRELARQIDQGLDYCKTCAEKAASEYQTEFPDVAKEIGVREYDGYFESDIPAACCVCHEPLSCCVLSTGKCLDTIGDWLAHD